MPKGQGGNAALARQRTPMSPALAGAVGLWAEATTGAGVSHRDGALRDKQKAATDFFEFVGKSPGDVQPADVQSWRKALESSGFTANSVYVLISRISSFYKWAMRDPTLARVIEFNPVLLARPRKPKAYQTESTKAYTDDEMQRLLSAVAEKADGGSVVAKRDYALLLIYFLTGLRRNEVITLRGKDVEFDDGVMILRHKQKGGKYAGRELRDEAAVKALLEYLRAAGRDKVLGTASPLWTRHDLAGRPGAQLSSHALARNLKQYAAAAGVKDARLHRTRHTFARIVGEATGSMAETQEALDHEDAGTTRAYVKRIVVKRDKHSGSVAGRLKRGRAGE